MNESFSIPFTQLILPLNYWNKNVSLILKKGGGKIYVFKIQLIYLALPFYEFINNKILFYTPSRIIARENSYTQKRYFYSILLVPPDLYASFIFYIACRSYMNKWRLWIIRYTPVRVTTRLYVYAPAYVCLSARVVCTLAQSPPGCGCPTSRV